MGATSGRSFSFWDGPPAAARGGGDTLDRELLRNSPVTLHRLVLSKGQDHEQQMFYFRQDHGVWLDAIVRVARDKRIDGMIVSNTTVSRPATLRSHFAKESGGLSGAPLFDLSTRMLAQTFLRVDGQFPLVGVGGIDSAEAALAKIEAGATLVQLYSALVYEGPSLVTRIKHGLIRVLARDNDSLAARIGRDAAALC